MNNNNYMLMDASAVEYKQADGSSISAQQALDNSIDKLTKEGVEGLLGLTKEEIEAMADLILDTEVRIDKTYSSSKIYSAIQDAIDSSKNFTLNEIGKMSGASYKVVTSTTEMTDEKIIYLLENGTTYDMYIVETTGTATKIGDTTIDLSSNLKVTDAESTYLKKTEATSTYVAQTSFNNHITDTVAHLTQFEKNKLLTTDNITSTINNSSDNTQVPSAKATYDLSDKKVDKTSIITAKNNSATDDQLYSAKAINTELVGVVKKTDIVTTIDSSSTDDKVPSAKTVNDILSTVTGITNVKIYCLLSQLGITTPCTIKDIWDKMPSGSVVIVDTDSSIVTDLDVIRIALGISDGDEVYGILTVVKLNGRTTLEFRRARTGKAKIPDTFFGYCNGSDCTSIQWKRMAITEVAEVLSEKQIKDWVKDGYVKIIKNNDTDVDEAMLISYKNRDLFGVRMYKKDGSEHELKFNASGISYAKNGVTAWSTGGADVGIGVTTITPVNSAITGNIEYTVKNGICYVSMKDLMSTISSTNLLISTTMPKPSINCTASSVNAGGNIAMIYIDKNATNLRGNFYTKNAKSDCSFSYPVAES